MPLIPYAGFCGPSYQGQSLMADNERLINRYLERTESPNAPAPWSLPQCPGYTLVASVAQAPLRALFSESGRTFFITGYAFYELNSDDSTTLRGSVANDQLPATISSNGAGGNQLFITSGDLGYAYNLTTHVLTTPLASGAAMGAYLDGYFMALNATTSTLQVSAFEDGTTWPGASVSQRTAGSDPWKAVYVVNRLIYLLGEKTSEVWWDAGTSPFPFAPIQEGFMQQGIAATFSGARLDKALVWLSHNEQGRGQIVSASTYTPGRVSNHAVEASIQTYTTISDALAFSYQDNGHVFYSLTFPTANRNWTYDQTTGMFHERLYWDVPTASWLGYRPAYFCAQGTRNLVGDRLSGSIYAMSSSVYTDVGGAAIRRLRQPPRLSFDQKRFVTNSIQVVMDTGFGLASGQGSDPQMIRQTSTNGGASFGNEHWSSTGKIGEFRKRVRWTQCGQARNRVDRFIETDPVPMPLVDCLIDVSVGTS